MLYFFERRLKFKDGGEFVEVVPKHLILSIQIMILGGLTDVGEVFDLAVGLFDFEPFFGLFVSFELLFLGLGVSSLGRHSVT